MTAEDARLEHRYELSAVSATVLADSGISVERGYGLEAVQGQVVFDWHAGFGVNLSGDDAMAQFGSDGPLEVRLANGRQISVTALWSQPRIPNGGWDVRGSFESVLHGDPGAPLVDVIFHAANWPHSHFGTDGHPPFRTVVEADVWELTLDKVADYDHIAREARLRRSGATTHIARLRRLDGQAFTWSAVHDAFRSLHFVMSFTTGHHVAPMFATGVDAEGRVVVEEWGDYKRDPMSGVIAWSSPFIRRTSLGELWPVALQYWQDERTRGMLTVALELYLDAQKGRNVETRLVSAQAGLELLAWEFLTRRGQALDPDKVDGKTAPWRFRKLLGRMGVAVDVPATLTEARSQLSGHDGPKAIADVRNEIVHPKDLELGDGALRIEILRLATWYLELAILHLLDYHGNHINRTQTLPLFEGEGDPVPWAAN